MALTLKHDINRTLILGLPLVGSQVAQVLVGLTDTLMLGWYSVPALAAVTIGSSFFFVVFVVGAGFANAVLPLSAEAIVRDDETRARRVARMGLWLSALFALATAPLFIWSEDLLLLVGQDPQVAADAQDYLRIAGLGILPALLTATLRSHLSALERTNVVLWATLVAAVLNGLVNWLLIFGNWGFPELGLRGAAIASVGVHLMTTIYLMIYALRGPQMARFELLKNIHRAEWPTFAEIFRLGWPIGLTHLAESGLFAASALMMGWVGTVELAAHGIAIQIAALTFMVHMGLSAAATVRVGQAWGRRDRTALIRASVAAGGLSFAAVLLATALYLGAGEPIIAMFVDPDDPAAGQILTLGAHLLILAALFQLVDAGQVMALGALRGVQDTRMPMVYAVASYWILGVPASYVMGFPMGLGPDGIWLGLTVGLAAAAVALTVRFVRLTGKMPGAGLTSKS